MSRCVGCKCDLMLALPPSRRTCVGSSRGAAPTDVAATGYARRRQATRSSASPQTSRRFDERVPSVIRHGRITEQCSKRKQPPICTHSADDPAAKKRRCWCGGARSHQSEAGRPFYPARQPGSSNGAGGEGPWGDHGATMVRPVEWGREPFDASMGRVGRVRGRYY